MSVEELFGLKKGDYIDKTAGYPDPDDTTAIAELKQKYELEFKPKFFAAESKKWPRISFQIFWFFTVKNIFLIVFSVLKMFILKT